MMQKAILSILALALSLSLCHAQMPSQCAMQCNDLRFEVLTLQMCKDAKKTFPKPKVGDFCSRAMEQGFSDACIPLCLQERPKPRVAEACRAAAIEMPRPTVRKWCEHGYNQGYYATAEALRSHFVSSEPVPEAETVAETVTEPEPVAETRELQTEEEAIEPELNVEEYEGKEVITTIPISIDDKNLDLFVYEGQSAEDAVVLFCKINVSEDMPSCIRQLLPTVIEHMEAL